MFVTPNLDHDMHGAGEGGGPTLWLEIPRAIDLAALEPHLARRGVHVSNSSAAFIGPAAPHLHGFRVAYAYLSEDEMRRALTIVGDALRELSRPA